MAPFILGENAWSKLPNLKRLVDEISARPAAARAIALKDKFKFKAEMDDEARRPYVQTLDQKGRLRRKARLLQSVRRDTTPPAPSSPLAQVTVAARVS